MLNGVLDQAVPPGAPDEAGTALKEDLVADRLSLHPALLAGADSADRGSDQKVL